MECYERIRIQIVSSRYFGTMADSLIRFDPLLAGIDGRIDRDQYSSPTRHTLVGTISIRICVMFTTRL